ncbi:MAG: FMN-binding protein [Kineosporiaceae bacterium]
MLSYRASVHGGVHSIAVTVAAAPQQPGPSAVPRPTPAPTPPPLPTPTAAAVPAAPTAARTSAPRPAPPTVVRVPVPTTTAPPAPQLFTGGVAQTPYGPVQVQIAVSAGRITAARTLRQPGGDPHSASLASYAVPRLDQETLSAQSAHIDVVTGATYTSEGYIGSLQSALDAAHLR